MSSLRTNEPTALESLFRSIPLASLRCDTVLDFDLFLQMSPGDYPVLFRERHLRFDQSVLDRLADHKHSRLFVSIHQVDTFRKYVESNLKELLSDPAIPLEEKSRLVYEAAQGFMVEVMKDPRVGGVLQRTKDLVNTAVDFMAEEDKAFKHLLKVVSFDYYTYTHSINVFIFSIALAQRAGIRDSNVLHAFGQGALLHDIGKSSLPASIINQKGKLSDEQWKLMKRHPELGYEILKEQGEDRPIVLDVIRHHHEKLDGSGYPDGLKGDEISIFVRINTIADIFDALTTNRSYKSAMRSFQALKLMKEEMSQHLDYDLFRHFVQLMSASD